MKSIFILAILSLLLGCSSNSKPISKTTTPAASPSKKTTEPVITAGPLNISNFIQLVAPADPEHDVWPEVIDNKNGYAKMLGYFEGYIEYFLFTSSGDKNLVVQSTWGCGPACDQTIRFFVVKGKAVEQVALNKVLKKTVASKYKDKFEPCLMKDQRFGSFRTTDKCSVLIEFPKVGTSIKIYEADALEDEKYTFSDTREGKLLTTLKWNKKSFQFE